MPRIRQQTRQQTAVNSGCYCPSVSPHSTASPTAASSRLVRRSRRAGPGERGQGPALRLGNYQWYTVAAGARHIPKEPRPGTRQGFPALRRRSPRPGARFVSQSNSESPASEPGAPTGQTVTRTPGFNQRFCAIRRRLPAHWRPGPRRAVLHHRLPAQAGRRRQVGSDGANRRRLPAPGLRGRRRWPGRSQTFGASGSESDRHCDRPKP
jgi:hypothetical protein